MKCQRKCGRDLGVSSSTAAAVADQFLGVVLTDVDEPGRGRGQHGAGGPKRFVTATMRTGRSAWRSTRLTDGVDTFGDDGRVDVGHGVPRSIQATTA